MSAMEFKKKWVKENQGKNLGLIKPGEEGEKIKKDKCHRHIFEPAQCPIGHAELE